MERLYKSILPVLFLSACLLSLSACNKEQNAEPKVQENNVITNEEKSAKPGDTEIEDYIEDSYPDPSESYELVKAACNGDNQKVKELLEKDPSIINKESFIIEEETTHTPLSCALNSYRNGYTPSHSEVVKTLVTYGVDVNQIDPSGQDPMYCTPLQLAVLRNDAQIVQLLLANGVDANLKVKEGYCSDAMETAENNKNAAIIELLKTAGVK